MGEAGVEQRSISLVSRLRRFSCKNFSKLYNGEGEQSKQSMLEGILNNAKGSTGKTFSGMMGAIANVLPPWVMWENVVELLASFESMDFLNMAFKKLGYVVAVRKLTSSRFGLPQVRHRAYGLCMHVEKAGLSWRDAARLVEAVMDKVA